MVAWLGDSRRATRRNLDEAEIRHADADAGVLSL